MEATGFYNSAVDEIRSRDFPALAGITYVDHAGATLYAKSQISAIQKDLESNIYGNPHSGSPSSRLTTDSIEQIRFRILRLFNTTPDNYSVIFTSGCTAALKLVAESFNFSKKEPTPPVLIHVQTSDDLESHPQAAENGRSKEYRATGKDKTSTSVSRPSKVSFIPLSSPTESNAGKVGYFCYLQDNHTSVQGMREVVADKCSAVLCLTEEEAVKSHTDQSIVCGNICRGSHNQGNAIFAFAAQSNFSGKKYPLEWIEKIQKGDLGFQKNVPGHWFVLLDAAAFVSTNHLDLGRYPADFVTLSFYKIFGFPTGLGALLVRNSSSWVLDRKYFGGGTVAGSTARERFCALKANLSERFEDGTLPFLDIIALRHGFDTIDRLAGGIDKASSHAFMVAQYFARNLAKLKHGNETILAEIYAMDNFESSHTQGAIVNFTLHRANGDYIGFAEVDKLAQLHDIHLRTGCFCNIGACQLHLGLSSKTIQDNLHAGHVCGDDRDLINGHPTGSVRISFSYMSNITDAIRCLQFIANCFLEVGGNQKPAFLVPDWAKQPGNAETTRAAELIHQNGTFQPANQKVEGTKVKDVVKVKGLASSVTNGHSGEGVESNVSKEHRKLTNICLFPIKSAGALHVKEWPIGQRGLLYDRTWMVASDNGVALGQKREPRLCLLKPIIHLDSKTLELTFPGVKSFMLPVNAGEKDVVSDADFCTNKVCNDRVNTLDCGDGVAEWLCNIFEKPGLRLLQQIDEDERQSKRKDLSADQSDISATSSSISLANECQFLLISRESVRLLQKKLNETVHDANEEDKNSLPTTPKVIDEDNLVDRFRANLVIDGGQAFDEETWTGLTCGDISFTGQGKCSRCGMVCLDQSTGEKTSEPLRTLASWKGGKIYFGIYLRTTNFKEGLVVKVGDTISLVESSI